MHPALPPFLPLTFPFLLSQLTRRITRHACINRLTIASVLLFDDEFLVEKGNFFFFFLFKERSLQYFCSRYKYNKSDKEGEEGMKMRTKGAKDERCSFRDRFTRSVTRRVSTKQIGTSFRTILKDIWPRNLSQGIYRGVHVTRSTNRLNPRARSGGVATLSRQAHRILKFTRRYTVSPKLLETTNFAYQCAWIHPPPCLPTR